MSKKYSSVDEMTEDLFKESREFEKKHPVLYRLRELWYEIIYRIPNRIDMFFRNCRRFVQRGKRGYGVSDVWGFYDYLANVISGGLTHLKENRHGHPCDLTDKQWHQILDKIIWTFTIAKETSISETIYIPSKDWTRSQYNKCKKLCEEWNKKYPEDNYKVLTLKQSKKFEEGFDLFKEYFFNLWD